MEQLKALKRGAYSHEQHELILRLEIHLQDLVNAVAANDPSAVLFFTSVANSLLDEVKAYNTDYRAWLESKRSGA